jgi:methionyl-tRNA synthetase
MAVYCGVCAGRISSAFENQGSFQTTGEDFGGWDLNENGRSQIGDTCDGCAPVLRAAVVEAARSIAKKHKAKIEERKKEFADWEDRQKRIEKAKSEFERDWVEHRRKNGL